MEGGGKKPEAQADETLKRKPELYVGGAWGSLGLPPRSGAAAPRPLLRRWRPLTPPLRPHPTPAPSRPAPADLSKDVKESDLLEAFAAWPVTLVTIPRHKVTTDSLGYAYVNFQGVDDGACTASSMRVGVEEAPASLAEAEPLTLGP